MQMTLFDKSEEEKLQQLFINDLKMGSNFEDSKERIKQLFNQNLTKSETINRLIDEYGTGGKTTFSYSQRHDSKGISITLETKKGGLFTWDEVYDVLFRLIESEEYFEVWEEGL